MDEKRFEIVERQREFEARDERPFDRMRFAMRALDILRPRNLKVVLYERAHDFQVERGRDFGKGPDAEWALVGIPRHATREHIAWGLAQLVGAEDVPFVVDLLLRAEPS